MQLRNFVLIRNKSRIVNNSLDQLPDGSMILMILKMTYFYGFFARVGHVSTYWFKILKTNAVMDVSHQLKDF